MTSLQIAYLAVLGFCILGSGFFSGSETALVSVPRERVEQLLTTDRRRAERLAALIADPDRMLSTLLVANNFVNILGASVATVLFVDLLGNDWGPWAATGAVTAVVLLVGEITPKSLATRYPERFSLAVAPIIWLLQKFLRPISALFLWLARGIFKILRIDAQGGPAPITDDDIRAMARLGERTGEIEASERDLIHAVFSLADRTVREVMTPRSALVCLEAPLTLPSLTAAVSDTAHSRYPVIDGDLDNLVGVLYVKDAVALGDAIGPGDMERLIREPYLVPETKTLMGALHDMRESRTTFALVVDEHGGVEGAVTIKDIMATLVGELQDEFDPSLPAVDEVSATEWDVDGRVAVERVRDELELDLPSGPYSTIGGFVLDQLGRIPDEHDSIEWEDATILVTHMDGNRVDRLRITVDRSV